MVGEWRWWWWRRGGVGGGGGGGGCGRRIRSVDSLPRQRSDRRSRVPFCIPFEREEEPSEK
jgi:hypothetical protein